ncbi:hypothetical protein AVEN_2227-1 [Araneus ventricosus]|uniref:IGFBP N-terminal domain-containing protein n=1 Tax=Araneus ventricosus TaxID=182803 RepID=A0A4Y2P492_ARAVE|nr:hypothetical protein AVEN_2227-1 [Araneus ventricosus]
MHKIIFLLLTGVAVASAIACAPHYCDNQKCADVSCSSDQKYNPHGTFCGCCPACQNIIPKGGNCFALFLRGGGPPKSVCADGLHCDFKTKTCQ